MREILFRGKRVDNGEWVYGYYSFDNRPISRGTYITCYSGYSQLDYEVIPKTVGQYTGLTDKNNRKIFEGDICKVGDLLYKVIFSYGQWYFDIISTKHICCPYFCSHCGEHCEVVGNIFDNSEPIKE